MGDIDRQGGHLPTPSCVLFTRISGKGRSKVQKRIKLAAPSDSAFLITFATYLHITLIPSIPCEL